MAETGTFIIYRGTTFERTFAWTADSVPVDVTGKAIVFHLLKSGYDADVLTLSSADGANANGSILDITDAANGEFSLKLTDEETAALAFDAGNWWLSLVASGDIRPIGRGPAEIRKP